VVIDLSQVTFGVNRETRRVFQLTGRGRVFAIDAAAGAA
jgi:anti-anti-sigma regulatory factor